MSEIKLQVGKTYRNRKGEEVKIVEKNVGLYSYKGSNGGWYAENGRYFYYLEESSNDLIEEVTISDANQNTTAKMKTLKLQVDKTYQLIKDWYHSKTGVSLMHDPSIISLINEIEALGLAHVSKSLPIKKYDIDFDGKILAGIEISENTPKVFGAIDGYGDGISIEKIKITERGGDVC